MVNQQLKDYVNEQLRVGVSKDAIKGALVEAGWAEAEINEAMGMMPAAVTPRVDAVAPAMRTETKPMQSAMQAKPMMQEKPAMTQAKPMQQPSMAQKPVIGANSRMDGMGAKPIVVNMTMDDMPAAKKPSMQQPVQMAQKPQHSGGHRLADIVMGLLILALGAGAVVFFLKTSGLEEQLGSVTSDRNTATGLLSTLQSENENLKSDNAGLEEERQILTAELGIFSSSLPSGEEQITVTGVLSSSADKNPYTLRTKHGVVVTIKNSRLTGADAVFTPLLATEVTIVAKHQVGSRDMTALEVNGTPLSIATSSATSSTSTPR